ncbi:MAG: hypothetical protein V4719_08610 [Planctomycetota bacterium]
MAISHFEKYPDLSYPPPRGNVLLLSCMDLRLLDDIVEFMKQDNLSNRYDQFILAGAALGALGGGDGKYSHWRQSFFDHLEAAHTLHDIKDVYILEHRNCGAYHKVFQVAPDYGDSDADLKKEADCHRKYAQLLEEEIATWAKARQINLRVRSFLMGIRGDVSVLTEPKKPPRAKRK